MKTPRLPPPLAFAADPRSREPAYVQLAASLAAAIRGGRLAIGERLPSERLYAQQLGLSRTTVTAAYQELMAGGLVRGHVGRGTTVIADDPDRAAAGAIAWPLIASRLMRQAPSLSASVPRGTIPMASGWLHASLTPHAELAACAARVARDPEALVTPAPVLGLPRLRAALVEQLRGIGIRAGADEVLVTGGAQQGINVVARALVAPGDTVLCESPGWHGAFRAFRAAGAEVAGVAMDHDGIDPDALETALIRLRPKLVYLIPSFHCPTGRLLGLERRRRVLEICTRLRTPILESHVYADTGFGEVPRSLKALDSAGIVIHQGSVSKTLCAALRLGWLVAPPAAMELLAPAKTSLDLSTPALPQATLAAFLEGGGHARHLAALRAALRDRRDVMRAALAVHAPELRHAAPQGGLYLWLQLPAPLRATEFEAAAAAEGVAVRAGDAFLPEGGTSSHVRLCYAAPAADEIGPGVQRLGRALKALLQKSRPSAGADMASFAAV